MPRLKVDEPTLEMVFSVNSSPMVGREGSTSPLGNSRHALKKSWSETSLGVEMVEGAEAYAVKGRGVLPGCSDRNHATRGL